ncbi:hypothetical protein MK079_00695 [Candidatus Gracilibacteria bacterium]|nr:hypothetical protein [Candidatus Gracilibacteria bacterium]
MNPFKLLSNIQTNQTLILSGILSIGVIWYGLDITVFEILLTFSTVIVLDLLLHAYRTGKWVFPYSGVNAGFGISFFLRSDDAIIYVLAGALAIFGKHFFLVAGKHFLNPSNMAVFLTLMLFPGYTWVNTLQWGNYTGQLSTSYIILLVCVFLLGLFMCLRVFQIFGFRSVYDYILPFLLAHGIAFFTIASGENMTTAAVFFSISFFIFTFFMITDPKTIPKTSLFRSVYAIGLVVNFYILQFFMNENYALLGSLFMGTLLLPVIWKLEAIKSRSIQRKCLILYLSVLLCLLAFLVFAFGRPDLAFDNICNQRVCLK